MEVLYPPCAGLDVHKDSVVSCIRIASGGEGGYALVFLCSPLDHLRVASERSAGTKNSCPSVG